MSYYTSDKKSPPRKIFRGGDFLFVNSREGGFPQSMNSALVRWDISLTLNMTYFSLYVILNAVKNPTEELTSIYFITLFVGYFADAQYDVLFKIYLTKASATFNPVALSKPLKNALEFTSQTVKPFSVNKKSIPQ